MNRVLLTCVATLVACNSYEGGLLASGPIQEASVCGDGELGPYETCDRGIPTGEIGACPSECPSGPDPCRPTLLVGEPCQLQCVQVTIDKALNGDRCCPPGGTATVDSDCGRCGDGVIGPGEACDPPEACPREDSCTSEFTCLSTVYSGSVQDCTASCELQPRGRCGANDGCCPNDCGPDRDRDCSTGCGDGVVDQSAGEVCEPGNGPSPCLTDCDDGDPCTLDMMVGSPSNCNVTCARTRIARRLSGDRCCPAGATPATDRDCGRCGNGMVEDSEECDSTRNCSAQCKLLEPPALLHHYSFDGTGTAVRDAVGDAHGVTINAALAGDGNLALPPEGTAYVDLPNGVLSALDSASLEFWLTWRGDLSRRYERIFDFGRGTGDEDVQGRVETSLFLSPNYDQGLARLQFKVGDAITRITAPQRFPANQLLHIVVALDSQRIMTLYLNGERVASAQWLHSLRELRDINDWLGRSQASSDPGLSAIFHDFRIYDGPLSPAMVRANYTQGPQ